MNYLFYGSEELLIKKEIQKIMDSNQIDDINKVYYNLENDSLRVILDDALTISLFDDKKVIIVENAYIFTGSVPRGAIEQDVNLLLDYFNNGNPDTILIFITLAVKLDERKKIVKRMKECGSVKQFEDVKDFSSIVSSMFKPYKISKTILSLFIDRVGKDLYVIEQEIEKIKTYKNNDLEITEKDVLDLTVKSVDADIFELIECIISNDKKNALEIYREMMKHNEEPIKILIMLANQFRLIYQAKELSLKGYSSSDIASVLAIHPYRVKLALEKGRKYSSSLLLSLIDKLAMMDYGIKSGSMDKNSFFELFILEI